MNTRGGATLDLCFPENIIFLKNCFFNVFHISANYQRSALFYIKINYVPSKTTECLSMPLITPKKEALPFFHLQACIECFDLPITINNYNYYNQLHVAFDVLQSVITKWGSNPNSRQLVLQSRAGITKWVIITK